MLTYRGTVYPWQCDHMGHMNVMWYVGKFDEATWQLFNALGLSPSVLRSAGRGMAAVDQRITYAREVHAGAVLSVTTRVEDVQARKLRFTHEMRNDDTGDVVATTTIVGVHLDTQARRACAFPGAVVEAARAWVPVAG
ncbi:MAG: thioesterase family protein [Rubrivivax sp.]